MEKHPLKREYSHTHKKTNKWEQQKIKLAVVSYFSFSLERQCALRFFSELAKKTKIR